MLIRKKSLKVIIFITLLLLGIPLLCMQLTEQVQWTLSDFLIAGVLLLVTGLILELALIRIKSLKTRLITCCFILFSLLTIWTQLAVGIF